MADVKLIPDSNNVGTKFKIIGISVALDLLKCNSFYLLLLLFRVWLTLVFNQLFVYRYIRMI